MTLNRSGKGGRVSVQEQQLNHVAGYGALMGAGQGGAGYWAGGGSVVPEELSCD